MPKYTSPLKALDIKKICLNNDLDINETQWILLERWVDLILKINQKVNLISRKSSNLIWEKHVLPCLTLLIYRKFKINSEVCDFGTGGGFPGMILAIVRPDLNLTLFESRKKKVNAVEKMIEILKINNAQAVLGRGEELAKKSKWIKRFPYITSRAVAPIMEMVRWTADLRSSKSVLHLFKGGEINDEINTFQKKISDFKIKSTLMKLNGYQKLADEKKYLISMEYQKK